jgi:hypothetical protein
MQLILDMFLTPGDARSDPLLGEMVFVASPSLPAPFSTGHLT